jgi:hypothetical protein
VGLLLCGASFWASKSSPVAPFRHIDVQLVFFGATSVLNDELYLSGHGFSLKNRFASDVRYVTKGGTSEPVQEDLETSDLLRERFSFSIVCPAIEPVVIEGLTR